MTAAAVVTASPDSGQSAHLREGLKAFLILAAFTLLTRGWIFGNPVVNMDEQFYLFVGERMWQGELPYVDIWDRKPVGLFLIYALAVGLFPNPVIGYQLLATLAVVLTAQLIFTVARRLTSFSPALAAAAAYPAWLLVFGGIGGQSPVFYNLPMAIAAVWTMARYMSTDDRRLTLHGCAIMLLVGVAIQIKYTALFEGIFFGLSLLWTGWRHGRSLARLAADGAIWIAAALAATLAAWAAYAAIGQSEAFVQANFLSVIADANPFLPALGRLAGLLFGLSPLYVCIWFAWRHWRGRQGTAARQLRWLLAWADRQPRRLSRLRRLERSLRSADADTAVPAGRAGFRTHRQAQPRHGTGDRSGLGRRHRARLCRMADQRHRGTGAIAVSLWCSRISARDAFMSTRICHISTA